MLRFARDAQTDTIMLSQLRDARHTTERLWQALLSTAPTPPLSDEELVG